MFSSFSRKHNEHIGIERGSRGKAFCSVRSSKSHGNLLCFFPATARSSHDSVLAEVSCLQPSIATSKDTTRDFRKSTRTHEVSLITGQTVELNAHQPRSCLAQLSRFHVDKTMMVYFITLSFFFGVTVWIFIGKEKKLSPTGRQRNHSRQVQLVHFSFSFWSQNVKQHV